MLKKFCLLIAILVSSTAAARAEITKQISLKSIVSQLLEELLSKGMPKRASDYLGRGEALSLTHGTPASNLDLLVHSWVVPDGSPFGLRAPYLTRLALDTSSPSNLIVLANEGLKLGALDRGATESFLAQIPGSRVEITEMLRATALLPAVNPNSGEVVETGTEFFYRSMEVWRIDGLEGLETFQKDVQLIREIVDQEITTRQRFDRFQRISAKGRMRLLEALAKFLPWPDMLPLPRAQELIQEYRQVRKEEDLKGANWICALTLVLRRRMSEASRPRWKIDRVEIARLEEILRFIHAELYDPSTVRLVGRTREFRGTILELANHAFADLYRFLEETKEAAAY